GQGSQKQGMGEALFDSVKEFLIWEPEINALLGYSLRQLCLTDESEQLNQTQYTQPALYVVNTLHYLKRIEETNQRPDYVAGHSLGEYNALCAAGAFDFMTGLQLVQKRGALMAQAKTGSMVAVIGLTPDQIEDVLKKNNLVEIDIANYNSPLQTVISGTTQEIAQAKTLFNEAEARLVIPLPVSAAFHSRLMAEAADQFAEFLTPFDFNQLTIPVISNVTARPYPTENPAQTIKQLLVEQIIAPVQWTDTIRYLLGRDESEFEELGPGTVLSSLIRRIRKEATPLIEEGAENPPLVTSQMDAGTTPHQQSQPDDLKQVKGIGPKIEALLHKKGVTTLSQMAVLEVHQLDTWIQQAGWKQFTNTSAWIEQARQLTNALLSPSVNRDDQSITKPITTEAKNNGSTEEPASKAQVDSPQAQEQITAHSLGSSDFKADYGLEYAYIAGAMYKGIASKELVVAMGQAGMIGYLGTGGMSLPEIEENLQHIQAHLNKGQPYGMNLLSNLIQPDVEDRTVDLFLRYNIRFIEAAAYMQMTPSLVRYRLTGVHRQLDGTIEVPNFVLAKVSRPEVATLFMQPAPQRIVDKLVVAGQLSPEEAALSQFIPMSHDICVEADSGGHTDQGVAYALMPAMMSLRAEMMAHYNYDKPIRVGAAGGIGTPEAAAAAFILGAEFILTGSINQCTVEAGMSEPVKEILQGINVQDTAYAPAGDMFELGAKVQVLRRSVFFPARANKLYNLYQQYNSLDEIDLKTQQQIQDKYFKRSFDDVWAETKAYYQRTLPEEIEKAERNPKHKMALIFRWYFIHTTRLAMSGSAEQRVDYQVHCGPALGAFNQWVKGTELESWRNRHVAEIGKKIIQATATLLNQRFALLSKNSSTHNG
ncbi:MAG: ACP S-malonyltransferase, partial [Chloroflexota bacterium]